SAVHCRPSFLGLILLCQSVTGQAPCTRNGCQSSQEYNEGYHHNSSSFIQGQWKCSVPPSRYEMSRLELLPVFPQTPAPLLSARFLASNHTVGTVTCLLCDKLPMCYFPSF